jgi:hypothetical protein
MLLRRQGGWPAGVNRVHLQVFPSFCGPDGIEGGRNMKRNVERPNTLFGKSLLILRRVVLLSFCCAIPSIAQYTNSSLNGTIVDPSGSAVAGAKVQVENVATGFSQTATSTSAGFYGFSTLPIGTYRLTVEASGFGTYVQTGVLLTVNQVATQNVTLKVGSLSQQVDVSATAPLVTTTSATVGELVSTQQVVDLPLNGRTVQSLLFLGPGARNTTANYCAYGCIGGVFPSEQYAKINGAGSTGVVYLLDGADFNDVLLNTNLPFPNPDATQEFNTQTSNMTAEYGNAVGGVVSVVTKSGSNQIHGDVFEFIRNGALNAKNYFAPTADTLKRNQFGATLGGPIMKNKLFYFGSYQGTRISTAPEGVVTRVPTAQERTGNFSDLLPGIQLVNPVTGAPYPNNQVPVSPVAANLLASIPLPNGAGRLVTFPGAPELQNEDEYLAKIDFQHNKHQLSGHYLFSNFNLPLHVSKTNLLQAAGGQALRVQNISANYVYTASPNLLLNTWYSLNDESGQSTNGAPYGFNSVGVNIAEPSSPTLNVSVGGGFGISAGYFGSFVRRIQGGEESLTWIKGKHELHFGGSYDYITSPKQNQYGMGGAFTFSNNLTGDNIADFVVGQASSFTQQGGIYYTFTQNRFSAFAQDNWRVNSRLALQLGLRWDPFLPYYEADGRVGCYEPGKQSVRYPNAPIGLIYGGSNHDAGCPPASFNRNLSNVEPRFGFAYQPSADGKSSVRGGVGLYYSIPYVVMMQDTVSIPPFAPAISFTDVSFADPYASAGVANPFPAAFGPNVASPANAVFPSPLALPYILAQNVRAARLLSWNLTMERQLAGSWLARLAYVGNRGTDLSGSGDVEEGKQELNPAIYIPGQSTEANTQQRRINPAFSNVDQIGSTVNSNYNALQASLRKQYSHGLSLTANYTWSKSLDDYAPIGSSANANTVPFDQSFDYGPSPDDVTNVLNVSPIYQLPGMTGNGWQGKLTKGWQASSIISWQSGTPFTVYSGVDNSFSGVGADRGNFTGASLSEAVLSHGRSHSQLVNEYFNTSFFAVNPVGTFGNTGKNVLRGPRYFDTDLAFMKNTQISERFSFQFRAEAFNLFNNVNFMNPGSTVSDTGFGQITAAQDPRILQFALKILF